MKNVGGIIDVKRMQLSRDACVSLRGEREPFFN